MNRKKRAVKRNNAERHSSPKSPFFMIFMMAIGIMIILISAGLLSIDVRETIIGRSIANVSCLDKCCKGVANISFNVDYNFIPGKNYSIVVAAYRGNARNNLCQRAFNIVSWENATFSSAPVYGVDNNIGKYENLIIKSITASGIEFSESIVKQKKLYSEETYVVQIQDLDCKPSKCRKYHEKCDYKTGICCSLSEKERWFEMDDFHYNHDSDTDQLSINCFDGGYGWWHRKDCWDYSNCITKIVSPKIHLNCNINVSMTFGDFTVTDINKIIPPECLNCTDDDSDGYSMEGGLCGPVDCNDADASIHPGVVENCNGIDDNCDGLVDEGCLYAPTVSITTPFNSSEFKQYIPITFSASASDFDGNITSYQWTSSRDGVIGNSVTFMIASLSVGTHVITVTVTDNDGLTASSSITVIIEEPDSPVVSIISPNNGEVFVQGTLINFIGSAIPQGSAEISSIIWTSSRDGVIYSSTNITDFSTSSLSVGNHIITLFATDNHGKTASYLIQIEIKEADAPSASIISPIGRQFRVGQNIVFGGSATVHGGTIVSQEWSSNRGGFLGSGQTINVFSLSVGLHTITYKVTDSNGKIGTDTIVIEILDNDAPVASILLPSDNEHFKDGSTITFSGIGDQENIIAYTWYSDIDGFLSHSAIFSTSSLSIGKHAINFIVEDDDGQTASSSVTIFVMTLESPKVSIISPLDESDYRTGQTIEFIGSASDSDGNISSYQWISSIDGILSSAERFSSSSLSLGNHIITLIVTDDDGKTSTSSVKISVKPLQAPTASIVKPSTGEHFRQYSNVEFIGSGSDPDGFITDWIWSSSIDGVFGNSQNVNSSCLSLGKHDITLTVIDNDGLKYIDTFTIWIEIDPLTAPDIFFNSPASGTYKQGASLFFDASHSAIDSWKITSSLDGVIKSDNGDFVPFYYGNLSLGHHYLTIEVFDHGVSNSATVELWVVPLETPNVTINSPASGTYDYGTSLIFNASILGNWTSIIWNSNLDGNIGNSPEFVYSTLTAGKHLISVIVTNADNQTTIVQATITILPPPVLPYCGDGTCNAGETCSTCSADCGSCGGGGGGGGGGGARPYVLCNENWQCSTWRDCINGIRTRACFDINNCGTINSIPAEREACLIQPAPTPEIIPLPAPTPEEIKNCRQKWIVPIVLLFLILIIVIYEMMRFEYQKLFTLKSQKLVLMFFVVFSAAFFIFLTALCFICRDWLFVVLDVILVLIFAVYSRFKNVISLKLFY